MRCFSVIVIILSSIVSPIGWASITTSEQSPLLEEISLGAPVTAHTLWGSIVARHPEDNRALLITGSWCAGGNAPVFVFDYAQNSLDIIPVDAQGTYGVVQGSDGCIYIGTVQTATLYRYDLIKKTLQKIGKPSAEETWLYNLVAIGNHYVLGGTFGGGRLAGYDLKQKRLVDFGPMNPPDQYVSATAPGPDNTVYCGIASHAELIHFYPQTGNRKKLLPEKYLNNSFINGLRRDGDFLYALALFDNRILVFDTRTDELLHDFGENSSMVGSDGIVWVAADGVTGRWDAEHSQWIERRNLPPHTRDVTADDIAFTYNDGVFSAIDMKTNTPLGSASVGEGGDGQTVFALHTGPDGEVYGSSYNLHHIFRVDSETGETTDLGNPIPPQSGEVYAFANHDSLMYMASYTYARLSVYDIDKPWLPKTNPRLLGELGHEQYRTPGLTIGPDKRLYIGSTPAYGKIGGALSIYDPETDEIEVFRHLIPNQSVSCLVSDPARNRIIGGSWIKVGGGLEPIETDAHLFAWDCDKKKLVSDFVPQSGGGYINQIYLLPDGSVLASCGDRLIHADLDAEETLRIETWPGGTITAIGFFHDGIYINSSNGLYLFNPDDWGSTKIAAGGSHLAFDNCGYAYYARGPELFRIRIQSN